VVIAGLLGLGAALLCAAGFVVSTVHADSRVHLFDQGGSSGFRGVPAVFAAGAVLLAVGSLVALFVDAVGKWAP
jgi:hypothetical protein